MIANNSIYNTYQDQLDSFYLSLQQKQLDFKKERVLALTIQMNRLRVLFLLLDSLLESQMAEEAFSIYKKIYKCMGRIQAFQLHQELVKGIDLRCLRKYIKDQKHKEHKEIQVLKKLLEGFSARSVLVEGKGIEQDLNRISSHKIRAASQMIILQKLKTIGWRSTSIKGKQDFLFIQKELDRTKEIWTLSNEMQIDLGFRELEFRVFYLEEKIRDWRDLNRLLSSLDQFAKKKLKRKDQKTYHQIYDRLTGELSRRESTLFTVLSDENFLKWKKYN